MYSAIYMELYKLTQYPRQALLIRKYKWAGTYLMYKHSTDQPISTSLITQV